MVEAEQRLATGFGAMKLKVGFGVESDIEDVHAIREAVEPEARIMMDPNCPYDVPAVSSWNARTQRCISLRSRSRSRTWKVTDP